MKFLATLTLLAALLGMTNQANATPNPIKDAAVKQDLIFMQSLGTQYHITAGAVREAWRQEGTARQQDNVVAEAMASSRLVMNRFALSGITGALVLAKAKLFVDIKTAGRTARPVTFAE